MTRIAGVARCARHIELSFEMLDRCAQRQAGAIHIHFEAIAEQAPDLLLDKDAAIVTYCSNGACH
jgi:rhodanese-related sulfurtransferase